MDNNILLNNYLKINKILLSTIDFKNKTVEVFSTDKNETFTYEDFFLFMAKHYDIMPDFIDSACRLLNNFVFDKDNIETNAEYKKKNGKECVFKYHFVRQDENRYMLFINEIENYVENLDSMTKADSVEKVVTRAKNGILTKSPFLIAYIDIDNFKAVNDMYGQAFGDSVLIEMVASIKSFLGSKGFIARVGGDRFFVIYRMDSDYDDVHDFLFDLKMKAQDLSMCHSRGIRLTVTIGSSRYPVDGDVYELLDLKCKKALIRGKNKGRDCFIMYLEEKCGKVSLDDKIEDKRVKINDEGINKNNVYSLITEINQLLSDDKTFDASLDKALAIIGDYYYVDRVSVARLNIKTYEIMKHHSWYNPKVSIRHKAYCVNEIIPNWGKALGTKNYVNIDDASELPDDNPLKELFKVDNTTASLSFELITNRRSFGLIRFDMTTGKRHWQFEALQVLLLISQLLATYLQKSYLKETDSKVLNFDPKYPVYNFTKFFSEAGDFIIIDDIQKYSIVEIEIRNIVNYRSLIGEKRMMDLVTSIIDVFVSINDIVYGKKSGGPFVVFVKNQDKEKIDKMIDKLNKVLEDFTESNHFNDLSLQTGVYFADAAVDRLVDSINNADLARVLNKSSDPLYYSDEIKAEEMFKNEMVLRIDEAIENGEFLLYLQPKISTKDCKLIGAEALTRWKYKHEKLLFPDEFIPLFESQGIVDRLDYSVFDNVCKYQNKLIIEGKKPVPISVNVSRYVSDFDEYLTNLEFIRNYYGIPAELIEIEITEGMYYENTYTISDFINKLHNCGYKVSMDDFGSGYSNLVSIAKLKFDTIKFDRSFCLDLDNENVKVMLDKLIELIKMMNMYTICEGVETKENVDYLTKIGCDSIQGYYYSKPIPYQEFKEKYQK